MTWRQHNMTHFTDDEMMEWDMDDDLQYEDAEYYTTPSQLTLDRQEFNLEPNDYYSVSQIKTL